MTPVPPDSRVNEEAIPSEQPLAASPGPEGPRAPSTDRRWLIWLLLFVLIVLAVVYRSVLRT
jgi:hypothetical protein